MPDLGQVLADVSAEMATMSDRGKVADYIPELSKIDPAGFAMVVATNDGAIHSTGLAEQLFSIQSVSKVFTLTLALGIHGNALWKRVGREPSGSAFNSAKCRNKYSQRSKSVSNSSSFLVNLGNST